MRWPSAVDELLEQRDAVLFGEWVQRTPTRPGEACLAVRVDDDGHKETIWEGNAGEAVCFVAQAIANLANQTVGFAIGNWNDEDGRTKEQVLEVLDEAIRIAKSVQP